MSTATLVSAERCPVCGGEEFRTSFEEPPYRLLRCERCGTGVVSPRLAEPEAIYADGSYWRSESPRTLGYHDYRSAEPLYLRTFRRRLAFVLGDHPRRGAALDVGCAAGFCMAAMRELGFEAHGVEVSGTIARHAVERLGFDTVHVGTLESAPYEEGTFGLITMWDVIEHVPEPTALLSRARELLAPDGLLVVETQNIDSAFARALGRRWHHYKHAEHIYHFTPRSLRRLLETAGFTVERMTPRYAGKYVSLDFIAERAGRVHPALSVALRPLTRLASVSVYINVMDEVIATARSAG
jgi:SAM-dependent methyltransferase